MCHVFFTPPTASFAGLFSFMFTTAPDKMQEQPQRRMTLRLFPN